MEMTKLTVRIPRHILESAKVYAGEHGTSLSRLVAEYLSQLEVEHDLLADAPTVKRLTGIISDDVTKADYHRHLEEKYGVAASRSDRPESSS